MEPINEFSKQDSITYERLSIQRVKQEKGFENLSDEQAEQIIRALEIVSAMHVDYFLSEHKRNYKKSNTNN